MVTLPKSNIADTLETLLEKAALAPSVEPPVEASVVKARAYMSEGFRLSDEGSIKAALGAFRKARCLWPSVAGFALVMEGIGLAELGRYRDGYDTFRRSFEELTSLARDLPAHNGEGNWVDDALKLTFEGLAMVCLVEGLEALTSNPDERWLKETLRQLAGVVSLSGRHGHPNAAFSKIDEIE